MKSDCFFYACSDVGIMIVFTLAALLPLCSGSQAQGNPDWRSTQQIEGGSLLLVVDNNVLVYNKSLAEPALNLSTDVGCQVLATDLFFHRFSPKVFYMTENQILRKDIISDSRIDKVIDISVKTTATELAVDWEHKAIYYLDTKSIKVINIDEPDKGIITLVDNNNYHERQINSNLAVDPYERKLFWISNGDIVTYSIEEHQTKYENWLAQFKIAKLFAMTINVLEKKIYFVGLRSGNSSDEYILASTHYNGLEYTVISSTPELAGVKAVGAYGSLVFWYRTNGNRNEIFTAPKTSSESRVAKKLLSTDKTIQVFKVFPDVLTVSSGYLCWWNNCSHPELCAEDISAVSATCRCPDHMYLMDDSKSCREDVKAEVKEWKGKNGMDFFDQFSWMELLCYCYMGLFVCCLLAAVLLIAIEESYSFCFNVLLSDNKSKSIDSDSSIYSSISNKLI